MANRFRINFQYYGILSPVMSPRIAFVKSSLYQDLWVCEPTNDPIQLLKTSMMRCPAIGLAEHYGADFIIVRDTQPHLRHLNCIDAKHHDHLQHATNKKNPELPFLDETYHAGVSIHSVARDVDTVDWASYQIVITINACVPERIVRAHPKTRWCYFIGENRQYMDRPIEGYHVILNQDVRRPGFPSYMVGFPYTYVGPFTLEKIYMKLFDKTIATHLKQGIYMEINNTSERPVQTIPPEFVLISKECYDMEVRTHDQNIVTNLQRVCESKYFVKLLGRLVRGNSVVECVSAGTLILANRRLVMFADLIDERCHCETAADVIAKIHFFENHPQEYKKVVFYQRQQLDQYYFKEPMQKLIGK